MAGSVRESVRDSLGINMEDDIDETLSQDAVRRKLREGLSRLPVPKNEFEIVVPEDDRSDAVTEMTEDVDMTPDADDLAAERLAEQRAREEYERKLRSQAVQRGLPRPATITSSRPDLTGTPFLSPNPISFSN